MEEAFRRRCEDYANVERVELEKRDEDGEFDGCDGTGREDEDVTRRG